MTTGGGESVNLGSAFGEIQISFENINESWNRSMQHMEKTLSSSMIHMGSQLENIGGQFQKMGANLGLMFAPLIAGFAYSIHAATDFEEAFTGVIKTVEATEAQLDSLRQAIRDMATDPSNPLSSLENAHVQLAKIMELGGQLGVPTHALVEFTQVVGELGLTTNLTTEEAATMIARIANVTGLPFNEIRNFGSTIVDLGNNFATTEKEILEMMNRIAASGDMAGMTEANMLAYAATMSSVGLTAELAGTNFSKALQDITKMVAEGGGELDKLAEISGYTAAEFAQGWAGDAAGAFEEFLVGLSKLDPADQLMALDDLGFSGTEITRIFTTLAGNTDLLADSLLLSNQAWGENAALTDEARKKAATTRAQMALLRNTIKDTAITVGDILLPSINDLAKQLQPIIENIAKWISDNPDLVSSIAIASAVVAGLSGAMVVLGTILSSVGSIISVIGVALGSSLFAPIMLVVGAITALGVAYKKNFLGFGDLVKDVTKRVKGFVEAIQGAWEMATSWAEGFGDSSLLGKIRMFFTTFEDGSTFLDAAFQKLGFTEKQAQRIAGAINSIAHSGIRMADSVKASIESLKASFNWASWADGGVIEQIKTFFTTFSDGGSALESAFEKLGMGEGAARGLAQALNEVAQIGIRFFESFQAGGLGGLFEQLVSEIENKVEPIKAAISNLWESVKAAAPEIGQKLGEMTGQALTWIIDKIIEYGPLILGGLLVAMEWIATTGIPEFNKFATLLAAGFVLGFIEGFDANALLAKLLLLLNGIIAVGTPWARELLGKILAEVQGALGEAANSAQMILQLVLFYVFDTLTKASNTAKMLLELLAFHVFDTLTKASGSAKMLMELIAFYISDTLSRAETSAKMIFALFLYHMLQLSNGIREKLENIKQFFTDLRNFVGGIFDYLNFKAGSFAGQMIAAALSVLTAATNIGSNIVNGIRNGIDAAWEGLKSHFSNLVGELEGVANFVLGNNSPSRVFADEVGKWIPAGIAAGIDENMQVALNALGDMSSRLVTMAPNIGASTMPALAPVGAAAGGGGQTVNFDGGINFYFNEVPKDPQEFARQGADKFMVEVRKRGGGIARA